MAMIKCRECASDISDQASSCPKCGCPLVPRIQEIEQTGKKFKRQLLMASGLTIVSMLGCMGGASGNSTALTTAGMIGFLGGILWFATVRFLMWWHHG